MTTNDLPGEPDGALDLLRPLNDSVRIFRMFRPEGPGTNLYHLLPALEAMQARLTKYDGAKRNQWRTLPVDSHLAHAIQHLGRAFAEFDDDGEFAKQLTAATLRLSMALTCFERRGGDSLSLHRASTATFSAQLRT